MIDNSSFSPLTTNSYDSWLTYKAINVIFTTSNILHTSFSCYKDFTISRDPSIIVYEMSLFRLKSGSMKWSFSMSEEDIEKVEESILSEI